MSVHWLEECIQAVTTLGLLQDIRPLTKEETGEDYGFVGEIDLDGNCASIMVDLRAPFPIRLPNISLSSWDALGFIPHVLITGAICYQDKEGLVLDRNRPSSVATEALQRAIRVLEDGVAGRNKSEFANEFDVYWNRVSTEIAASMLNPPSQACEIVSLIRKDADKKALTYFARTIRDLAQYFNTDNLDDKYITRRALYVPLQHGTLIPPRPDREFWTAEEVRSIIKPLLSEEATLRIQEISKRQLKDTEIVLFGLPRPAGGVSIFGIRFSGVKTRHPLLEGGKVERIEPFSIRRMEKSYLVPRGGGEQWLAKKRVLLAGGGAIGGYLAFELVRAGILNLTLVDPDNLEPENTFRHVLGRTRWWEEKAKALGASIESQFPYAQVKPIVGYIEQILSNGSVDPRSYDLIVLATGNPTAELEVNSLIHRTTDTPPVLFSWLEPYGIGGHALVTNNTSDGGCLECLYTSDAAVIDEYLSNRASFAAPNQTFGLSLTGCGSLHTPYGSVAALQTAALATCLAIDTLTGAENGNPLRSWKGQSRTFSEAKFRLSARYACSQEELDNQAYLYRAANCKVCGNMALDLVDNRTQA